MRFRVIPRDKQIPTGLTNIVILWPDSWDDWFKYNTMYISFYFDAKGVKHRLGEVKIGEFKMEKDQRRPSIPDSFTQLSSDFFSLGQDDSYYQAINDLGDEFRDQYLIAIRDVAKDNDLFDKVIDEDVTGVSLLRSVSDKAVRGQLHRMAMGGARLTPFSFSYTPPSQSKHTEPPTLKFKVSPESSPPTNVHVLIGRNGVGKTHTVNLMTNALVRADETETDHGDFEWGPESKSTDEDDGFPSIISVTFSAFDPFEPVSSKENKSSGVRYQYIGLKHITKESDGSLKPPKSPDDLSADFGKSVQLILTQKAKSDRWRRAITLLESDRLFQKSEVWRLADMYAAMLEESENAITRESFNELRKAARKLFGKLSSGHKIVLLTVTRLIETLEERSLVLLDEPEAHLHPPLLSAFIRSLSDLLVDRNGVAIIATHSPVILQEVPRTCVWRIKRSGKAVAVERPRHETFGENVGALTQAIFGLEVTDSGFHKLLADVVNQGLDYEAVLKHFNNQLGDEARAIARSLIATRDEDI